MLRRDPCPDRPEGPGFVLRGEPIKPVEFVFGRLGWRVQGSKKLEQALSLRAFPREAPPDGFVFVELADTLLDVVEGRKHGVAVFFGGMHGGDKRA
jgi:hypothetical protein